MQNVFIYIDDSGVFDKTNNKYFVHAGYIFFSKREKDDAQRMFTSVEKKIKARLGIPKSHELKSFGSSNKVKSELYKSLNKFARFSCIVNCEKIKSDIWSHKKHKQRFLDYTIKRTVKDTLVKAGRKNLIDLSKPVQVNIFFDNHTTATSGKYELKEAMSEELLNGTFNFNYQTFFKPILVPNSTINLTYCDSKVTTLIRASDIVANRTWREFNNSTRDLSQVITTLNHHHCSRHP